MRKRFEKINLWTLDKKMKTLITIGMLITLMVSLAISTVLSVRDTTKRTRQVLKSQNDIMAQNFYSSLESYKAAAIAMVMDRNIQQYLKCDGKLDSMYPQYASSVNQSLYNCIRMYANMNFIAVISNEFNDYKYRGNDSINETAFEQNYRQDYENCTLAQYQAMKIGFNNTYYNGDKYTLNIYYPIYDVNRVSESVGLLCMNFSDNSLEQIFQLGKIEIDQEIQVMNIQGKILSGSKREKVGTQFSHIKAFTQEQGEFYSDGYWYIYEKVPHWNYYVVSNVPKIQLYQSSIQTIGVSAISMLLLLVVSIWVVQKMVKIAYQPVEKLIQKMDLVSEGSLKTRMNEENLGKDFKKLAVGFNKMMDEMDILMNQVKEEQHQIDQIRMNALQSQIKPHFLYNTLDCIHWQAVADGNNEISILVKALAKYYRICLSNGRDIITLSEEVEHLKNYLIIQNIRYDNIIDSDITYAEMFRDVKIPKITLQPLVENSIYHGLKVKEGRKGKVVLTVRQEDADVIIVLSDNGIGMSEMEIADINRSISQYDESFGYGVRNVHRRMELLFGMGYGLKYKKNVAGGISVEVRIPYHYEEQ